MCKKAEMQFSVFLIHQLAQNWKKSSREVYQTLDKTHILDDYIIKHYDVLHSMGEQSLADDLIEPWRAMVDQIAFGIIGNEFNLSMKQRRELTGSSGNIGLTGKNRRCKRFSNTIRR